MKLIALRLTDEEHEALLTRAAGDHARNLSQWIRARLFTENVDMVRVKGGMRIRRGKRVPILPSDIRDRLAPALKKKPRTKGRSTRPR